MSADFSEALSFAADLGKVSHKLVPAVDEVAKKGAQNLKEAYRGQASDSSFRGMAGSFSYEPIHSVRSVGYVVGPDKSVGGGALGNIFFFGGSHGGGGTGDLEGPLSEEEPRFTKALGDLAEDRIKGV